MALIQLVYVSRATRPLSSEQLAALVYACVSRNAVDGLSGLLLHADGCFLQLLEGERSTLDRTFARIARDRRHTGITLLRRDALAQRQFDGWHMAFQSIGRVGGGLDAAALCERPALALRILGDFRPRRTRPTTPVPALAPC